MGKQKQSSEWVGLDIGGANLKVSNASGHALSHYFPLWKKRDELTSAIRKLLSEFGIHSRHFAMTMTGELADCYNTKQEGVNDIIDSTLAAVGHADLRIATVDDRWLSPKEAKQETELVAAANWRLTGRYVANKFDPSAERMLLVDVGSTTIDLIPIESRKVIATGKTDTQRLQSSELVYCGTRRTSIDSLLNEVPYRNGRCPIMRERFATTADAWLLLGMMDEEPAMFETADSRPLIVECSIDRLAKLIGADRTSFNLEDAKLVAQAVADKQIQLITEAIRLSKLWPIDVFYLAGEGEFLGVMAIESLGMRSKVIRASETVSLAGSNCGPAFAAAWLASREITS